MYFLCIYQSEGLVLLCTAVADTMQNTEHNTTTEYNK